MKSTELEALTPELLDLLRAERARAEFHAEEKDRVMAEVLSRLGSPPDESPRHGRRRSEALSRGAWGMGGAAVVLVAVGFGVGFLAASGPRPLLVFVDRTESPVPLPAPLPMASSASSGAAPSVSGSQVLTVHAAPSAVEDANLARERRLLETARSALARQATPAALDALSQHEREYPRGRLSEERSFLKVQALASGGRGAEASEAARTFRTQYPKSAFLPMVDRWVQ